MSTAITAQLLACVTVHVQPRAQITLYRLHSWMWHICCWLWFNLQSSCGHAQHADAELLVSLDGTIQCFNAPTCHKPWLPCAEAITTKALRKMNVSSVSMEDLESEFDQAEQTVLSSYADALSGGSELMMTMPALADAGACAAWSVCEPDSTHTFCIV